MKQNLDQETGGIYGRGWAFPPSFDTQSGARMVADARDIHQSMLILMSTVAGERVMRRDYGTHLQSMVFDNISETLLARITSDIKDAVARHETRVVLEDISLQQVPSRPSMLSVILNYRIRGANELRSVSGELDMGDGRSGVFV